MKIDDKYEEHLASLGTILDLNKPMRDLLEIAENVYAMAFHANCFSCIRNLLLKRYHENYEVLSVSGAFFYYTENALTTSIVIEIAKIYDKNSKSKTLDLLDKKTKLLIDQLPTSYFMPMNDCALDIENPEERTSIINQLENRFKSKMKANLLELGIQIESYKLSSENIMKQRNKLYAHNDLLLDDDIKKFNSEHPVTQSDAESLVNFALEYSTAVISSITGSIRPKLPVNINDFDGLVKYVLEGYDTVQHKIKKINSDLA